MMEESRLQPPQGVDPPYQVCKDVERNSYCPNDVQCVSPHSKEELDTWKKTDQLLVSTVESIQEAQIFMLLDFAPHMGYKGDFSGNQLQQGSLLQQLLSSPELGSQKVEHIMEEWALSGVAKCISNEPMDMVKQAVIHIDTYDPEVARGSVQIPGEGRSLTCSTALLDVMQDYLMVALPKGSNRNPVVPLLELIECTRLSALVVIMLLLLQSGDVERNPGPVERAKEVLECFREKFIQCMDAPAVAYNLWNKNCIDRDAMNRITKTTCDPAQQNQILHLALKEKCTDEALLVACDIIIAVSGNPKMNLLGENMKEMLTGASPVVQAPLPSPTVTLNPEGAVDPVGIPTATRSAPSKRSPGGGDTSSSKRPRSCDGGTSSKAGTSGGINFAILTANKREDQAVRTFLKLGDSAQWLPKDKYEYAEDVKYDNDPYLESKGIKIEQESQKGGFTVFSLTEGSHKLKGVHMHCSYMGPWGAFDKTVALLKDCQPKVIFLVGCCGASIAEEKKKDKNYRGIILLAKQVISYLHTGKAETGEHAGEVIIDGDPQYYPVYDTLITALEGASDTRLRNDSKRSKIEVMRANYLSGPLVVKDQLFGDDYRGRSPYAGVEMEVVGVIKAVEAIYDYTRTPPEDRPRILLAKGISDYTGGKGEDAKCHFFKEVTKEVSDDALQVYATLQSITLVMRCVVQNKEEFQ